MYIGIVIAQLLWKKKLAKRTLATYKSEAKDVGKLQEIKWGLENKVMELSNNLRVSNEAKTQNAARVAELENELGSISKTLESKVI